MKKKPIYQTGSLLDFAVRALSPLEDLVKSNQPHDKLLSLNIILVLIVISFIISNFLNISFDNIASLVILALSFILGAILTGLYSYLLLIFKNSYKIKSLRGSIIILFLTIPITLFGLLYNYKSLINLSLLIIFIQFLFLLIVSLFVNEEIIIYQPSNKRNILGKAGTILGIISSIISILEFIIKRLFPPVLD